MNILFSVKSFFHDIIIRHTVIEKLTTSDLVSIGSSILSFGTSLIALIISIIAIYISRQSIKTKCSIGYMPYKRDNTEWEDLNFGSFITINNKSYYSIFVHDILVLSWRKGKPGLLNDYADWKNRNIFLTWRKRLFYRICLIIYKITNISIHLESLYDTDDDFEVKSMSLYRAQYDTTLETTLQDVESKKNVSKTEYREERKKYNDEKRRVIGVSIILSNSKRFRMRIYKLPGFSKILNQCAKKQINVSRYNGWPVQKNTMDDKCE